MALKIAPEQLVYFIFCFALFTPIGTLSHEFGHIFAARALGFETELFYASMRYDNEELLRQYNDIQRKYAYEINNQLNFSERANWEDLNSQIKTVTLLVDLGGPLQTWLTGIVGLVILAIRKKYRTLYGIKFQDWLAVFLSLFWLRQPFNLMTALLVEFINPDGSYFNGDELYIAKALGIWEGSIALITAVIGLLVALYIVISIVPKKLRLTFVLSGLIGGCIGFLIWMNVIGPMLLPLSN